MQNIGGSQTNLWYSDYIKWEKFNSKNFLRAMLLQKGKIPETAFDQIKGAKKNDIAYALPLRCFADRHNTFLNIYNKNEDKFNVY